jgi:hypothetical protein
VLNDYTAERLEEISIQLNTDNVTLLHCAGAGRVTYIFMAFLIKSKRYPINKAIELGKSLKYSNPLEQLLDTKIKMEVDQDD